MITLLFVLAIGIAWAYCCWWNLSHGGPDYTTAMWSAEYWRLREAGQLPDQIKRLREADVWN